MTFIIEIPTAVTTVLKTLYDAGHDAYIVGGCVRDTIIGIEPHDWDVCSSALPEEVKSLFARTVLIGEEYGTVTVVIGKEMVEVTTFRIDGIYTDGRHPDTVEFTKSLLMDLSRRDFTMNAIAYSHETGLVDHFGGVDDCKNGIVRCVGNPDDRFEDDAVRMMRAIRFSAQKGFRIDPRTFYAIDRNAHKITRKSSEIIRDELVKTITSKRPVEFIRFHETGLLAFISPELDKMFGCEQNNPHHVFDVGTHTLYAMEGIDATPVSRLTMLFHDVGKPVVKSTDENGIDHFYGHEEKSASIANVVMHRLKFENDVTDAVVKMVGLHMAEVFPSKRSVKRMLNRVGSFAEFRTLMAVKLADASAQKTEEYGATLYMVEDCLKIADEIEKSGDAFSKKDLAIDGHDLIEIGISPSPRMGKIFETLVLTVIDEPEWNTKEKLIEIVKEMGF